MRVLTIAVLAGTVAAALACAQMHMPALAQGPAAEEDKPENYPPGANRDDTYYFCTACHSFQIVAQQAMTAEQWDETVTFMEERHGSPKTEGKERDRLVEYLSTAFPPKQKPGWRNPFLK